MYTAKQVQHLGGKLWDFMSDVFFIVLVDINANETLQW